MRYAVTRPPPAPRGRRRPGSRPGAAATAGSPPAAGAVIVVMTYFPLIFVVSNSLKTGQSIFTSGVFSLFTQFDYQNYAPPGRACRSRC